MQLIINNKIIPVEYRTFSAGEEHVQIDTCRVKKVILEGSSTNTVTINGYLKSSKEVMQYLNLLSAVDNLDFRKDVTLYLPYLPYARQDRVCAEGQAFGLEMFIKMLLAYKPTTLMVNDVHSDVVEKLLEGTTTHLVNIKQSSTFIDYTKSPYNIYKFKDFVLVAPDKGSYLKTKEIATKLEVPMYTAKKIRNPSTGVITLTEIDCKDFKGANIWIVDDICDGGYTFTQLAKELRKSNIGKLGLFVTHGIFSKGKEVLYEQFDYVSSVYDWTFNKNEEEK